MRNTGLWNPEYSYGNSRILAKTEIQTLSSTDLDAVKSSTWNLEYMTWIPESKLSWILYPVTRNILFNFLVLAGFQRDFVYQ